MDMRLEAVTLPVSDVDRAKQFYKALGWREDADVVAEDEFRIVQLTPPGSPASIQFGNGVSAARPGSVRNLYLVVADVAAARAELVARGAEVSEVFHEAGPVTRARFDPDAAPGRLPGPDPGGATYSSFATFSDPDGNSWLLQEITSRLPGREEAAAMDVAELAELLREAEEQHGRYEPTAPAHHWYGWYAPYVVARRQGRSPDEAYHDASATLEASRR